MNKLAAVLLTAGLGCLAGGAYLLLPAAGLLVVGAGVIALGVMSLDVSEKSDQ